MGWEVGAIATRRVPVPLWMLAVNAQAAAGCMHCIASACRSGEVYKLLHAKCATNYRLSARNSKENGKLLAPHA